MNVPHTMIASIALLILVTNIMIIVYLRVRMLGPSDPIYTDSIKEVIDG